MRMNPLEYELIASNKKDLQTQASSWFMCIKAYEEMRLTHEVATSNEDDLFHMREKMDRICERFGCPSISDKYSREFVRQAGSKIHTTSAFLGGLAAQEAAKLITS